MKLRKNSGIVFIQAVLFFTFAVIIISITNDLHRGWTIINELNKSADAVATALVSGDFENLNAQNTEAQSILIGNTKFITNYATQAQITWLNAAGTAISMTNATKDLPLYYDSDIGLPGNAAAEDPAVLLNSIRVTLSYPVGSNPPFPSSIIRTAFGGAEIPLTAIAEKIYIKRANPKHFFVRIRSKNDDGGTMEYRPVCTSGPSASPFANQKEFWDRMCQVAAELTEPNEADQYLASGITSSVTIQDAAATVSGSSTITSAGQSSLITFWNLSNVTTFSELTNYSDCQNADSSSNARPVYQVACYPQEDGSFTAPGVTTPRDIRYVIIDETQSGGQFAYFDRNDACPEAADENCCNPQACPN